MTSRHHDVIVLGLGFDGFGRRPPARRPGPVACSASNASGRRTTRARATARPGSCGSPTSRAPAYVPLLRRAYEGWHELQEDSGRDILTLCGGHLRRRPGRRRSSPGARRPAEAHGAAPTRCSTPTQIRARFPAMDPADHALGLFEENAGFVRPEETILANLDLAVRHGAELRYDEPVRSWRATPAAASRSSPTRARTAPTAWSSPPGPGRRGLLADLGLALRVERQVVVLVHPRLRRRPVRALASDAAGLHRGDRPQPRHLRLPDGRRTRRRAEARLLQHLPARPTPTPSTAP